MSLWPHGTSSYIDAVILRDADLNGNGGWGGASDGTLEFRAYYCQNWRADVVATVDSTGARIEGDRYFAYGMPFGIPRADCNADGVVDSTDATIISAASGNSVGDPGYDVRADIDLDGTVDSTDSSVQSSDSGQSLGRGNLSRDPTLGGGIGNRVGYAGYQWDSEASKFHVRNRVIDLVTGTWLQRDPIGNVDGPNLYQYVRSRAPAATDPLGLASPFTCSLSAELTPEGEPARGCFGELVSQGGTSPPTPITDPYNCLVTSSPRLWCGTNGLFQSPGQSCQACCDSMLTSTLSCIIAAHKANTTRCNTLYPDSPNCRKQAKFGYDGASTLAVNQWYNCRRSCSGMPSVPGLRPPSSVQLPQ